MIPTLPMKDLPGSLRKRAENACARAEIMHAHAVEVAAQLSLVHEHQRRIHGNLPPPEPWPCEPQAHKLRLTVALQQERAALRQVDRQVRTQWLLQKGAGVQPDRSCML